MLEPPFLELQYYIGRPEIGRAIGKLVDGIRQDVIPRKLVLPGVVGLSNKLEELEVAGGVLILRTEGDAFCGESRKVGARLRRLGRRAYERFVEVADIVQSVYGAILVEYSLEEPQVIRQDPRSLAFRNFFLGKERLGQAVIEEAIRLAGEDAYTEKLTTGTYVSMSAEFNPKGRQIEPLEAQERSVRIAAVVGRAAR